MSYATPGKPRCDSAMKVKWYRFTGNGGSSLPETCPAKKHCDANAPGWLKGGHPTVARGEVSRKVCFHWGSNCCAFNKWIKVVNCSGYYVYEFQRMSGCYLRYCSTYDGKYCNQATTA